MYQPGFLSGAEEGRLLAFLDALEFHAVAMRGQTAKRTVRHFGLNYDYESWRVTPGEPLPAELEWVRDRAAVVAGAGPDDLADTLLSRYPAGAGIGWHRDAPMFGAVVGISVRSACRMRFQRGKGEERRVWELELEPRSAYLLAGAVRTSWQHSIPATSDLRYSITFRTLRRRSS